MANKEERIRIANYMRQFSGLTDKEIIRLNREEEDTIRAKELKKKKRKLDKKKRKR